MWAYDWDAGTTGHVNGCKQGVGVVALAYTSFCYILDTASSTGFSYIFS